MMDRSNKAAPQLAKTTLCLIIATVLGSTSSLAQDKKEIEEMVVTGVREGLLNIRSSTATKMDLSLKDTGRSVTQLDAQQLQDLELQEVRQAFDYVASFRNNGADPAKFTARGVRTDLNYVLIDGLRTLRGGGWNASSISPGTYNAESVVFMRGVDGLLYGSGLGGGMVNIVRKKPEAQASTSLSASARSYVFDGSNFDRNRLTLDLDSTGPLFGDSVLYRLIAQYTPSGDLFQESRKVEETSIDAAVTLQLGASTTLTPRIEYRDKDSAGGTGATDGVFSEAYFDADFREKGKKYGKPIDRSAYYGDPNGSSFNESKSYSLLLKHRFNDSWILSLNAQINETDGGLLDLFISDNRKLGNQFGDEEVGRRWVHTRGHDEYELFDGSLQGRFATGDIQHHMVVGYSYRNMDSEWQRTFQNPTDAIGLNTISVRNPNQQSIGPVPASIYRVDDGPRNEEDTNVYLKDRVKVGDLTVAAGLAYIKKGYGDLRGSGNRRSFESGSFSDTVWDVGVVYALTDDINMFATYSRSYEPISVFTIQRYEVTESSYDPEEGKNYEIGLKGGFWGDRLSSSVTVFRLDRINSTYVEDIPGSDDRALRQRDGESFRSNGLEWDATLTLSDQWHMNVSYAYVRAYETVGRSEGQQADDTPKHSLTWWNNYQLAGDLQDWRLGFGLRYEGERYDSDNRILASYVEADGGIYYSADRWRGSLVVRNLFDENRSEAGANWALVQPNEPRSVNLRISYDF